MTFYEELLSAPDRDACPGAGRMVSVHGDEDPAELAQLEEHAAAIVQLTRRGQAHGSLAEFDPLELDPSGPPLRVQLDRRWHNAQPIVLHDLVEAPAEAVVRSRAELFDELASPEGLRGALDRALDGFPDYLLGRDADRLVDPGRDLARVLIETRDHPGEPRPRCGPPWAKSARLSTASGDPSLRLRLGFGEEGRDDASRDPARLRQVSRLAEALFPEAGALHRHPQLLPLLADWLGDEPLFSQHIAYWNAPNGGALFHHDAFAESAEGGQRGVLYVQQDGWTAWIALSIEDLGQRVIEFMDYLAEDDLADLRRSLFPDPDGFAAAQGWCVPGRFARLRRELAKPGQGALGPLVNRGPEFTGFLADAGHAYLLGPGDGILLPNHGYSATCMHSVFCASPEVTFGLSLALRSSALPSAEELAQERSAGGPQGSRGSAGRGTARGAARRGGSGRGRRRGPGGRGGSARRRR